MRRQVGRADPHFLLSKADGFDCQTIPCGGRAEHSLAFALVQQYREVGTKMWFTKND
jgi:hypothetical protein